MGYLHVWEWALIGYRLEIFKRIDRKLIKDFICIITRLWIFWTSRIMFPSCLQSCMVAKWSLILLVEVGRKWSCCRRRRQYTLVTTASPATSVGRETFWSCSTVEEMINMDPPAVVVAVATIGYQGMEEVRGQAVVGVVVAMEVQIIKRIQSAGKLYIV
jgi:hypothetical protein